MQLTDKDGNVFGTGGLEITSSDGKPKIPVINTDITIGTTPITGGTSGRLLFDDAGVVSETNGVFWDKVNSRFAIGTTNPIYNLEVVSSTGYAGIGIRSAQNNNAELSFQNAGYALPRWTIRASGAANGSSGSLVFQRNANTFPMSITSGDNVLISTSIDSGYKLDVNGTARVSDSLLISKNTTGTFDAITVLNNQNSQNTAVKIFSGNSGGTPSLQFWSDYSSTQYRRGYIEGSDLGSYTGALNFYTNGTGIGQVTGSNLGLSISQGNVGLGTGADPLFSVLLKKSNATFLIQETGTNTGTQSIRFSHVPNNNQGIKHAIYSISDGTAWGRGDIAFAINNLNDSTNVATTDAVLTIKSSKNVLIGTTTDAGYKLDVNGTGIFRGNLEVNAGNNGQIFINNVYPRLLFGKTGTPRWSMYADTENSGQFEIGYGAGFPYNTFSRYLYFGTVGQGGVGLFGIPSGNTKFLVSGSTNAQSNLAQGVFFNNTLVAAANNDVLVGLDIAPTFTNGAFTGVTNFGQRISQSTQGGNNGAQIALRATDGNPGIIGMQGGGWNAIGIWGVGRHNATSTPDLRIFSTGQVIINTKLFINTTADAGFAFDCNGTARVVNDALINGVTAGRGNNSINTNTAFGFQTLISNTTGVSNTAIGFQSLATVTTGGANTAIGSGAMRDNISGLNNTALGVSALLVSTGNNNTAIGYNAGNANTTGTNNIFIGSGAVGASITDSNRTWIGNSYTTTTWLAGNVLIGTTTDAGYKLDVTGTGRFSNTLTLENSAVTWGNFSGPPTSKLRITRRTGWGVRTGMEIGALNSNISSYTSNPIIIGDLNTLADVDAIILGFNNNVQVTASLVIGSNNSSPSIGSSSKQIILGDSNTAGGYTNGQVPGIIIGYGNNQNGFSFSQMYGTSLKAYGHNQLLFGANAGPVGPAIKEVFIGYGYRNEFTSGNQDNGNGNNLLISPSNASDATDKNGGNLTLAGSRGTGSGNPGNVIFSTATTITTGTTLQTLSERMRINGVGNVLIGTTTDNGYKLEVNGTGYFGNNLRVNGTITASTPTANTYICHIALTADQVLVSGADAVLDFVDVADTNNWYDSTTKKFLPTVAGYYHVDFSLWFEPSPVSTGQYNIQVRKNGTTVMIAQQPTINNGTGQSLMSSKLVYFNGTTDYIDFTAYQSTGSNRNIWKGTDSSGTYATIHLLAV